MTWVDGPFLAFDTETTGVDPTTARIVTAVVAKIDGGNVTTREWLVNPGCEIPAEATAIHGITTEKAMREGKPSEQAVREITLALADAILQDVPVVAFNACYDLTVVDSELRRHLNSSLADYLPHGRKFAPVIDPFVIDKTVDRYRKGSRKLADMCAHYDVRIDGAHDATHDALAAARLAWRLGHTYDVLAEMSLAELHEAQVCWFRDQARSLEDYFHSRGNFESVPDEWPLRSLAEVPA